jgi:hypothetical protein
MEQMGSVSNNLGQERLMLIEQGISSITIPQGQQIGVFKQKKSSASK